MENTFTISKHAKERYALRILGKDDNNEIQRFIVNNEDKIKNDINKLIEYGEKIFTGKQSQKDGKGKVLDVYTKDLWVVLVDSQDSVVVTLYKIDLGLGDDFNTEYVKKYIDKIHEVQTEFSSVQMQVLEESNMYREMIIDAQIQIRDYKGFIKNLEELCAAYQSIIDNNTVKVAQANRTVADTVNQLIGKKEF